VFGPMRSKLLMLINYPVCHILLWQHKMHEDIHLQNRDFESIYLTRLL
jgi:hypothetical protein